MLLNGVAIGINFSVVVVSLGVLILAYFMRIMTKFQIIFLLTATMILLLGWLMVAQFFVHDTDSAVPVLAYGGFDFERIYPGMVQLARNLSSAIDLYAMIGVAAALLCFRLVYSGGNRLRSLDQRGIETRQKFIAAGLGCLGLIWFLCFCCNYWVIYNHEHVRYFITAILLMIGCFGILMLPNPAVRGSEKFEIAGIIILTNISMFYLVRPPISLLSYRAFTHIDFDMTEYPDVFAGDYWQVWPAVLRNMMNGQEAYGLSARWQGDREAITAYLSRIRRINGVVAVGCLNASIETCEEQIRNGIGENTLVGQVRAGKNSWLLQLRL